MAEHTRAEHKARLIADISKARLGLSESLEALKHDADLGNRFNHSFVSHQAAWLGGAGAAGWLISKIAIRKRKLKSVTDTPARQTIRNVAEGGLALSVLKFVFSLTKPAIIAFATRKISDMAARRER